jgi:lysozyme
MPSDAQPKLPDAAALAAQVNDDRLTPSRAARAAALCAAAALVCLPLTQASEGLRLKPYRDPAHILTVCYGETQGIDPAKIYSSDECATKLRKRLAQDYAPAILECLPMLNDERRIKVFGALLDAAYNAGSAAVCSSRMARSIRVGDWRGACNGFSGWYTTALNRKTGERIKLKGLVIRRDKEAALCMQGIN